MNIQPEHSSLFEGKILEAETRLEALDEIVREIGQPAGQALRHRLDMLKIESRALARNFEESRGRGESDSGRLLKIDALLRHIVMEEAALEEDADFLYQSAPSSVTLAVEAGAQMVDLYRKGMKHVIGDHHPLGASAFVNHTRKNLESEFGLEHVEDPPPSLDRKLV